MGRQRWAGLSAALAGLTALTMVACTARPGEGSGDNASPTSAVTTADRPESTTPAPLTFVRPSSPLVQDLWGPVASLRPMRTSLPTRLDFAVIQESPQLQEAPINTAVLAVGADLGSYQIGDVAVVSASGQWRMVERDVLGMRNPDIVEQQLELSPDGSTLALGDEFGIVFVDLSTGTATRVPTELKDPVIHAWTGRRRGVVVTRRLHRENPAWEVTMTDRTVMPVPYDPWRSAVGADGRVAEFVPAASEPVSELSFTGTRIWRRGRLLRTSPLLVGVPQEAFVANEWSSLVGILQTRSRKIGTARGVGALDPRTGQMAGFLSLPRRQAMWASVQGTLADRWLLLNVSSGEGGGIIAWDPVGEQLRAVTQIDDEGAWVSLAGPDLLGR